MDGMARVRASALAATVAGVSVGGHVAGGGTLPSTASVLGVLAICLVAGSAGARTEWTLIRLVALLCVAQAAFHVAFVGLSPRAMGSSMSMDGDMEMAMPMSGSAQMTAQATWLMVAGHLAAALVSSLLLVHADRAVERLLTLARRVRDVRAALAGCLAVNPMPGVPSWVVVTTGPVSVRALQCEHQLSRRGPPALHVS